MLSLKHIIFIAIAFISLVLTWTQGWAWIQDGGNILNPASFFIDGFKGNHASTFLSIDILAVWMVYMIWVVMDAKRIGLGIKWGVFFLFLSYLGTCFAFPIYLVVRERFLDKKII